MRGKSKYDASTALAYKDRPARQQSAEMALLDRLFALVPKDRRVLDLPCGGRRVSVRLARQGYQMSCADAQYQMRRPVRKMSSPHSQRSWHLHARSQQILRRYP
ncbi:MAG: hypothetical protein KDI64_02975 [Candidatus Accumulibacter sp.]|nr:hypothetical protein [Accumulibacter sp.]